MIKIATAECFTHGKIGQEIHSIAQGYAGDLSCRYAKNIKEYNSMVENSSFFKKDLSLICSLFIPTIEGLERILFVKPPKPNLLIKGIKIYDEEGDIEVSKLMAIAVKRITNSDIGIGTTAGIGKGGISIVNKDFIVSTSSDIYADLSKPNPLIAKRQKNGIEKTLKLLFFILNNKIQEIANKRTDIYIEYLKK